MRREAEVASPEQGLWVPEAERGCTAHPKEADSTVLTVTLTHTKQGYVKSSGGRMTG